MRPELDMKVGSGKESDQHGKSLDMKKDNGDMVECKVCHQLFKKRGINIHLAKTNCGKLDASPNSQRMNSKPVENQSWESPHNGKEFQEKRRVPFIVSQTFHNKDYNKILEPSNTEDDVFLLTQKEGRKQKLNREKEKSATAYREKLRSQSQYNTRSTQDKKQPVTSEADQRDFKEEFWEFWVSQEEEALDRPDTQVETKPKLKQKQDTEMPLTKKVKQRNLRDWMKGSKSSKQSETERNKSKEEVVRRKPDESSQATVQNKQTRSREKSSSNKITSYFGVKVKAQSDLGEWLTAVGNMSPRKEESPGEEPKIEQPPEDSTDSSKDQEHTSHRQNDERLESADSWEIQEQWEDETSDILTIQQKVIDDLQALVTQGDDKEILADHHLVIRRENMKSLYRSNYMDGTIADEYFLMIKARDPGRIAVMSTYFYWKFDRETFEVAYEETRRWIKEDLRTKDSILIPVCKSDHWRLIHIDTKKKVVEYLDSIVGTRKTTAAPRLMKRFVEKYYEEKGETCSFRTKILQNIPIQGNGFDCGIFMLTFAERLSRKANFNFHQSNMSLFRWKVMWEVLNASLKESIKVEETSPSDAMHQSRKGRESSSTQQKRRYQRKKKVGAEKQAAAQEGKSEQGRRKKINWPKSNSEEWRRLDTDLTMILREVGSTPEAKAELHPDLIYKFALERFGEVEEKKKTWKPPRRATKCEELRKQIKELNDVFQDAPDSEKPGIKELQAERLKNLRLQKRTESAREKRRKKKVNTENFYKQPYAFARKVLDPEVKGNLESTKEEVEEFLKTAHGDAQREEDLGEIEGLHQYPEPQVEFKAEPPSWKEFQAVLKKARTKSAAGPNGVPYKFYKNCPGVAKLLWWYIKGLWKKNTMSDTWRRAEGVLIPKEHGASEIGKFRTISLLNVEGKLFWKLKSNSVTTFIMKNKYIDEAIQKGGVPGVSGCIEHTAILSQLITEAKKHKKNLVATWLDICNAYGSIKHKLIQIALKRAHLPAEVQELVSNYYDRVEIRFSTEKFITSWQRVERGIITGCTLSVILFALSMTMLLSSTKKETRGPITESGQIQENSRLYMDDVSTTTGTVVQTHHLLKEIARFFDWARLAVKPSKCRVMVIVAGVVKNTQIHWKEHEITSVMEKPIKYLGKEYNHTLTEQQQISQTMDRVKDSLKKIDRTLIAGRVKAWIVQNMLLPRLMWPLTIYSFPQYRVEEIQGKLTASLKKFLGIPKALSTDLMYSRSAVLQLPYSSVVEEMKVARARTQVMLETSKDDCIKNANINLDAGRKWKVKDAVEVAKSKLRLQEIAGIANIGREGLGLQHRQYFSKSSQEERRKLVTQKVREAEEERRLVNIAGLARQGKSLEWQVQQRKVKDADMRRTTEATFQFVLKAVYDLLPTPQNLNIWYRTDEHKCHLCGETGTLDHILTGCKTALVQGRYKYRHDKILKELAYWIEEKRKVVNSAPLKKRAWIKFRKAGEKVRGSQQHIQESVLNVSRDWKLQVDLPETPLRIPEQVAATFQRPDIILTSEAVKQLIVIELTVPTEARVGISSELKRTKYEEGVATAARMKGWSTVIYTVEMGCRGFPAYSMGRMLAEIGYKGREKRMILQKLSTITEETSMYIYKTARFKTWQG